LLSQVRRKKKPLKSSFTHYLACYEPFLRETGFLLGKDSFYDDLGKKQ